MAQDAAALFVDWDNDGAFTGTGENVTGRTMHLTWERGRDRSSQLVGKSIGGRLVAVLNNASGDYSSFNESSPLTGNILPGRKVRVETGADASFPYTFPIVWGGNTLWEGFLQRVTPISRVNQPKTAILEAWGPLAYLNEDKVQLPMATNKATGTAIGEVLDEASWPPGDRTIDTGKTTMDRYWADRQRTLSALRLFEDTEGGFLTESKDGKVVFQDRHFRLVSPRTTSQATWSDAVSAANTYRRIGQFDELAGIFNDFEVEIQTYTVAALATLWTLSESGSSSPPLAPGEAKTFWARHPTPDSATDAWAVDAWTTPVENDDYDANTNSDGSGLDVSADIAVAVSKFANAMKITLTNNGTVSCFITLLRARGTSVTRNDPVRKTADDSASQTAYGIRTFPSRARFVPDTDEGQAWGDFNLSIHKDPQPVIQVEVVAGVTPGNTDQVITRDISERVTIVGTGKSKLGYNEDFFIERIKHIAVPGGLLRAIFDLSPATGYSGFWTLGVSKLGGTATSATRLAY